MKVGDKVNYSGKYTRREAQKDCTILQIERKGKILLTDMAVLDKVRCWVRLSELTLVEEHHEE